MSDIARTVRAVVAETFQIEPGAVTDATVAADVDGWDSVSHTTLMLALEDAFGRELPFEKIIDAQNVGEICSVLEAELGA